MDKCKRCGKCCHYIDIKGNKKRCRYLLILKDKTTLCGIYSRRIGIRIDENRYCTMRGQDTYDYEDCLYNTTKPILW